MDAVAWLSGIPWSSGECFKCEDSDVPVTHLGVLEGAGGAVELFACQGCAFRLESRYTGVPQGTHRPAAHPLRARTGPDHGVDPRARLGAAGVGSRW